MHDLMQDLARDVVRAPTAWASAPVAAADAVIAAALRTGADVAWIEPSPLEPERYIISMERAGSSLAQISVDAQVGTALIARLAFIANIDLSGAGPVTGITKLRDAEERERDLVLTVRTGRDLRAEALFVARTARPLLGVVAAELAPGDRVDHYRLLSRRGTGGMGSVFAVEHVALERTYALKVLHRDIVGRDKTTERFLREARAAARLRHPHIVDVFDFGYLPDGRPYFVMELLDGKSVHDMIDEGALAAEHAVRIALQLGDALAAAHDGGVIHADVSANNVIVCDEHVKLVDFGLSELRDAREPFALSSEFVVGTPMYVAPELLRGNPADELSDQYAFGILLFEMLAGAPPFLGQTVAETCWMHLEAAAPPVTSPYGALPPELCMLVARCIHKTASARYPDMRAVLADLSAVARKFSQRLAEVPPMSDTPRPVVLCVDDDPILLTAITRALRQLPAEVVSTTDPREALAMVGSRDIAVLVSDHEMPGMTGIELATAARRVRPDTVRILLTGRQTFETALQGINECEVFRYINKPFDSKTLRSVVGEALDRHRELVATSVIQARGSRRDLITSALESEYPGLTLVERSRDGAYVTGDPPADTLADIGLAVLADVGRR